MTDARDPSSETPAGGERDLSEKPIDRLLSIMSRLRAEGGCPWDREQTLETLKPYLIEESYEVLDAIDSGDRKLLEEELGDVLLQVVFQSQLCTEEGSFTFDDVATHICEKLVRRHPHVFGDLDVADSEEVLRNWEAIKKDEKGEKGGRPKGIADGVPRHLPAIRRADKIQKKAARLGFDWKEVHDVVAKIEEELAEVKAALAVGDADPIRDEIGDLLFASVNLSRFLGHNAEDLLEDTIKKFVSRFDEIERRVHGQGRQVTDCDLEELETHWEAAKKLEQG